MMARLVARSAERVAALRREDHATGALQQTEHSCGQAAEACARRNAIVVPSGGIWPTPST